MNDEPRCLFVYPEFRSQSFWNYRAVCDLVGAKYPAGPLGLITVAALLPEAWPVRLVDCNVEPLEEADLEWAEIVFTGGMIAQQLSTLELIDELKRRGKTVVVGGPDATMSPHLYREADHLVLGEAEITLPRWLADRAAGAPARCYECGEEKADVTKSPLPRFDLLKFDRYLHVGVQFARGCPFSCDFCDIIELFGRIPRLKTPTQMMAELQRLYDLGYRGHVDFVDDNFIGNKRDLKPFLVELRTWLEAHRWPFEFSTEASVNLADDEHLLQLMQDVGFWAVFVGVESPDEATLKATKKFQNTRRSLAESLRKIYSYGIVVNTGYIVGFDAEQGSVAPGILDLIEASSVPVNMVGLLFALPNTQLQRRLAAENRLIKDFEVAPDDAGDQCTAGLNFVTQRPRVDILRDYRRIIDESYAPEAYFGRVLEVGTALNCRHRKLKRPLRCVLRDLKGFARMIWHMGVRRSYRGVFWRTLAKLAWRNPRGLRHSATMMALYLHFGDFRKYVVARLGESIRAAHETQGSPATERVPDAPAAATAGGDAEGTPTVPGHERR
ncbi:MAG: B12-binding domain-containing radical SAM protein [Planctomycetota bacterium]